MLPGLSDKESQVYEALLYLGVASILKISEHSGLKRPTVYLQIDELKKKGLVIQIPQGNKVLYKAVDPARLEELAEEQLKSIQEAMPKLQHLKERQAGRPKFTLLEGKAGMETIYKEIMNAPDIYFWAKLEAVSEIIGDTFQQVGINAKQKKIPVREIINDTPADKKSSRQFAKWAGKQYSARIAPDSGIENDNVIYGNVLAIFRLEENNMYVIRIEDPSVAQTYKAIFEMSWKAAKPFL